MESKRTATTYFIPPGKFLLMENALGNPDLIQSSVSSDCRVTIVDSTNFPLDELEQWPTFRLVSADTKLKLGDGAYYIYIVVPTPDNEDSSTAFIAYNTVRVNRDGYEIVLSEDEEGNSVETTGELLGKVGFKYYQCGTVSAQGANSSAVTVPAGKGRLIEMDLGVTPAPSTLPGGLNDFDKVFQLDKVDPSSPSSWLLTILTTIKTMTARLIRVTGSLIFGQGENEKAVTDVAVRADSDKETKVSDTIIASTAWVIAVTDDRFLRKDKDDETPFNLGVGKNLTVGESVVSEDFTQGELGNGYILKYDKNRGHSYFEVDEALIRKVAYFVELIIKKLSHVGGSFILSPASMRCDKVEEYEEYYRCYFLAEHEGKSINQEFRVNDQARSQTFNVKTGVNHNVSSQYYWRLVVGISDEPTAVDGQKYHYIDLSKIDCDEASLAPLVGDDIVQLGNRTDPTRQNAIILSTVGEDAPSIKQYEGIQFYTLAGKEKTVISPKGNVLVGDFLSKTGEDMLKYIDTLGARLDDVQNQTDKSYVLWFFDYEPTLDNYPASEWATDSVRKEHVQDMFYNEESGRAYRFLMPSEGVFVWSEITDHETIKALEKAAEAKEAADSKIQNFIEQPTPPYQKGDRWSNATYGDLFDNDDLVCIRSKGQGESFDIADWQLANGVGTKKFESEISRLDDKINIRVTETRVNQIVSEAGLTIKSDIASLYVTNSTFNSSISALSGRIDLKVSSGDVVNSINASTEGITIDANKINLNGAVTANQYFKINTNGKIDCIGGTIAGFDISNYTLKGGNAYQMSLNVEDEGYPSIKWMSGSTIYSHLGMSIVNDNYSGILGLNAVNGYSTVIKPAELTMKGNYTAEITLWNILEDSGFGGLRISALGGSALFGVDTYGYIVIKGQHWRTNSAQVEVGEVFLDGNTLKVRTS